MNKPQEPGELAPERNLENLTAAEEKIIEILAKLEQSPVLQSAQILADLRMGGSSAPLEGLDRAGVVNQINEAFNDHPDMKLWRALDRVLAEVGEAKGSVSN